MIYHRDLMAAIWSEIGDRYSEGMSLDALAKRHRSTRHAITTGLQRRGLFIEGRRNKPVLDVCKRGHDMATHGRPLMKTMPDGRQVKNGRECMECKRARQRVTPTDREASR